MPERLVDVERQGAEVLHTFPVTVSRPAARRHSSRRRWRRQAHAKLVPNEELRV